MITQALMALAPNAGWELTGSSLDGLVWLDEEQERPTDAEILAKAEELQAAHDAKQYARDRAAEYPSIGDQLDALFHAGVFPDDMAATIQAVKDKYPKESA